WCTAGPRRVGCTDGWCIRAEACSEDGIRRRVSSISGRNSLVRAAAHTRDVPVIYSGAVSHSRLPERHGHEHVELAARFVTSHGVERPLVSLAERGDRVTGFV